MRQWMVRVWYEAYSDEAFIDEMPTAEYTFATEEEALAFKKAFNDKYRNHGGWEPRMVGGHRYGSNWVPGSPAEGPYAIWVAKAWRHVYSLEEAMEESFMDAEGWGMEEEEE